MAVIFKNENKMGAMSIDKRPDSFYDMYFKIGENDTKTLNYMSVYDVY
jgi:hypothetical protein